MLKQMSSSKRFWKSKEKELCNTCRDKGYIISTSWMQLCAIYEVMSDFILQLTLEDFSDASEIHLGSYLAQDRKHGLLCPAVALLWP